MKRKNQHTPSESLNKAFLRLKPHRAAIELFKANLITLLDGINEAESEEFHKNLVSRFLTDTYYGSTHFINTKGRNDLVIHNGKDARSTVGVIVEAKKPTNRAEMIRPDALNAKALQELLLYYLRERITARNLELKQLVATNIYEWMVFDAQLFERLFATDKTLVQQFTDFEEGRSGGNSTDFFYREIAAPAIEKVIPELEFTHFDIRHFDTPLRNNRPDDDAVLIPLFKTFSPEHLLKLPFANDSNSLDKGFYNELLHIIGLGEVKEGGKKTIRRREEGKRDMGAMLENAITQLDRLDKLSRLPNPQKYGTTNDERLFSVAMELIITWVNQILFLKLLEAQLIGYHKGDKRFAILTPELIHNYDDLNNLFFGVLAKRPEERREDVKNLFAHVPYLNSSLFEPTEMEHNTLFISNLTELKIPVHPGTVLKDANGHRITGQMETLAYLFAFLDAYDFTSEGADEIQEENKTLINASVLGLIFEKINGYKDGSFFTPGFITMYMARETLRRAVVQKFNEVKGWNCTEFDQLYDQIIDKQEANAIINSLKICDPAVGSGHFLVSCLNEMITIKSELKVLLDRQGKTLRDYSFEVVNDELIVTDDDARPFAYNPTNKETQRVQEALFHEKQALIENCLFGVDINPNSVKICRLRLWIELLKNAYYKETPTGRELETLPNIDINIKCGNSLVSRFALDSDIRKALKKSRWSIDSYRIAVMSYRNAKNKDDKRAMLQLINQIKGDFEAEVATNDKRLIRLNKLRGDLLTLTTQTSMFEMTKAEKTRWSKQVDQLTTEINNLEAELEAIKSNRIYENALEWRFEFPEVLNEQGDFVGFDVVIGNPPYLRVREDIEHIRTYYFTNFKSSENQLDLYHLFIERSSEIANKYSFHSLIVPNAFLANQNNAKLRQFILTNFSIDRIIEIKGDVFEEASVEVLIFIFSKQKHQTLSEYFIAQNGNFYFQNNFISDAFFNTQNNNFTVTINSQRQGIISKILTKSVRLADLFNTISGIKEYQIGKGKPPQKDEQVRARIFNAKTKINATYLPELRGKNLSKYSYTWENEYISYGVWLAEPRIPDFFKGDKILIRQIPAKQSLVASYVKEMFVVDQTAYIAKPKNEIDIMFYLGIINSSLLFWFFQNVNNEFDQLFPKIKVKEFNALPMPEIKYTNSEISSHVLNILSMKSIDRNADTLEDERTIDQLVYQLYNLTEEEISIIENT